MYNHKRRQQCNYKALSTCWKRVDGDLQVVWDVPENETKVQARLDFAFVGYVNNVDHVNV